jgi:hypothetical protein
MGDDMSYSTFVVDPSSPNQSEIHHITSVFSPVAISQEIDHPPVYQLEEMPPSYEDALENNSKSHQNEKFFMS